LTRVAITQRVARVEQHGERRDCLDQAWVRFLSACGLLPIIVPNVPDVALELCNSSEVSGLVLTGGNDLVSVGGDAPERDATENALVELAESKSLPIIAVCRGMQLLQQRCGIALRRVAGHVSPRQTIRICGEPTLVNSYHNYGATETLSPLEVWAVADDGVIKAVRRSDYSAIGIMWHPERMSPFASADIALFRDVFRVS
jgi:N5-(cytidine 5'-diphosphoramidyl)-L-glutamine hydrolase